MKEVYEAIRNGPQWNTSALIITYDEHVNISTFTFFLFYLFIEISNKTIKKGRIL